MLALALIVLLITLVKPTETQVSIEYSIAVVRVSPALYGAPLVFLLPFNASWSFGEQGVYVLSESGPAYYHVFNTLPPLVLVFESSAVPERAYRIYVSVSNPYASFRVQYTSNVFAAYDDFDVDTGVWVKTGRVTIGAGTASLSPNSAVALSASLQQDLGVLVSARGDRGLRIELPSIGEHLLVLTEANFTDWASVIDGSDVYFVNERGEPQYYSVLYLSKSDRVLIVYVVATSVVVFMVYGGSNPYESYRLR